ncbi:MAG: PorV/PorQ family protein [Rhodothermales bacterium]
MMRIPRMIGLVLILLGAGAHLQNTHAQHAGAFSRMGFGARGISMGNALAADVSGQASPWYNPAHAPRMSSQSLSASAATLSFDRTVQFLALGAPLQERAGFSVGLIHAAVSDIDGRDNSGFHTGRLSVNEYAGFLAFGLRFSDRFAGGLSFQFFRSDLFEGMTPARSVGLDVGFSYALTPDWAVAFVIDDLLARYSWDSSSISSSGRSVTDNFPRRLRLGVTHRPRPLDGRLLLAAELESRTTTVEVRTTRTRVFGGNVVETTDASDLTFQETHVRAGAEYAPIEAFALRLGLEQLGSDVLGSVRPSAGFRAEQAVGDLRLRAEYAFSWEAAAAGSIHLLTLTLVLP